MTYYLPTRLAAADFFVSRQQIFHKMTVILNFLNVLSVASSFSTSGCYDDYREISSKPYIKFDLAADKDCWDYCKYEDQCKLFSVPKQHNNRTCSLYKEDELSVEFKQGYSSTIFGSKNCLFLPQLLNETHETNILDLSLKDGVFVYKANPGVCLEADFEDPSFSKDYGYPVYWSSNCGNAKKWQFNCTGLQGAKRGCSRARVKVRDHPEYCLTFQTREDICTASMLPCFNGAHIKYSLEGKYQDLFLTGWTNWNIGLMTINLTTVSATLPFESAKDPVVNYNLDDVELISKEMLLDTTCRNLSVLNGQVLQSDAVPMFLPGEEMTVQCNPGYGAKFDNGSYLKVYNATCSRFPSLIDCSTLPTEFISGDSKALTPLTVLFAKTLILCLIIFG